MPMYTWILNFWLQVHIAQFVYLQVQKSDYVYLQVQVHMAFSFLSNILRDFQKLRNFENWSFFRKKLFVLAGASTHSHFFVLASTQIGLCVLAAKNLKSKYT